MRSNATRSLILVTGMMLVLGIGAGLGLKSLLEQLAQQFTAAAAAGEVPAALVPLQNRLAALSQSFWTMVFPVVLGTAIFVGLLIWLALGRGGGGPQPTATRAPKQPETGADQTRTKAQKHRERRLYVHLLTLLQREGRLIDFFSEDLSAFGDDQIGAAVRNIHENCRRAIQKTLNLKSVMTQNEGDTVQIEADFDPARIKLTGNVTGQPPFSGVLRHRGWRATKLELPTFAESQTPEIIAPAEVEIN